MGKNGVHRPPPRRETPGYADEVAVDVAEQVYYVERYAAVILFLSLQLQLQTDNMLIVCNL